MTTEAAQRFAALYVLSALVVIVAARAVRCDWLVFGACWYFVLADAATR